MQSHPHLLPGLNRQEPEYTEAYRVSDYLHTSARRWKLAVLTTLLGFAAAYGFCWVFPDTYVSYAQLLFLPPQVSERYVETNVSLQADQRVGALTQTIGSQATAGKLIQQFDLYPRLRRWWPVADLVPYFRSALEIKVVGGAESSGRRPVPRVEISFAYSDPATAQKVVQRVLEIIYEENQRMRSNQTFRTTDFLQRQAKEVQIELEQAEQRLEDMRIADPAQRFQATALATAKLYEVHRRLYATQFDLRRAVNERDLKQFQIESFKQRAATSEREATAAAEHNWTEQSWRLRVAEARARLEETQARYRPGHPDREAAERDVRRAVNELAKIQQTDEQNNANLIKQRLDDQVERMAADVDGLQRNIETLKKEEGGLLEQEKHALAAAEPNQLAQYHHLAALRQHELLRKRFEELQKKRRDSEVATEMERVGQGETITLVEPPVLPGMARNPVRWMKLATGSFLGLLFGLAVPIALLLQRPRIQSSHRLDVLLGTPILAELPAVKLIERPAARTWWRARRIRLVISTQGLALLLVALTLAGCAKEDVADLVARAAAARRAGKAGEAGILLRRAVQLDKRFGEAYREMAALAEANNDIAAARQALLRAVELIPEEVSLRVRLAGHCYRLYFADPGRPDALLREVEMLSDQIMEKWPAVADGYRLRAQAHLERRRLAEAIETLETGLEQAPGDPSLSTQLASVLFQDGSTEKASALLLALMDAGVQYPPAYDLYYLQLMESGQTDAADAVLAAKWKAFATLEAGLQLAAHRLAAGRNEAALNLIDEAVGRHAQAADAELRVADFWINRNDASRAAQWLDRGRRAHPEAAPQYAARQIEVLMAGGQREEAREQLARELKTFPGQPLLETWRAAIELEGHEDTAAAGQARVRLEAILSRMPDSPFVRYHLGRAYLRQGDLARAGEQFERCVTLDPNYALGWMALAEAHLRQGQFARAAEETRFLEHRGSILAPVYLIQARAELGRNRPAEAERSLAALLRMDPKHRDGRLLMVQAKLATGALNDARRRLESVLADAPETELQSPGSVLTIARLELALGEPQRAFERLQRAHANAPQHTGIAAALARAASRLGHHEAALEQYTELSRRDPQALEYALGVANALALLKKTGEAAEHYKKVQKLSATDARPWLNYAALISEAGEWEQAAQAYREALKREPGHPVALNNLADLITRHGSGDLSEALTLAEQAGRIWPDAPEVMDTLAFVYLRKGMATNAAASYRKLMERLPGKDRARLAARVERIERGDLAGALAEAAGAGSRL